MSFPSGLNGRVALMNFEKARLVKPEDTSTQQLFQQEMDKVNAMLGIKEPSKRPQFQNPPSSLTSSGMKRKHEDTDVVSPSLR